MLPNCYHHEMEANEKLLLLPMFPEVSLYVTFLSNQQ